MSKGIVDGALSVRDKLLSRLDGLRSVALLLGRLGVGLVFLSTGWGKVHSIPKVTEFFESLHIPMPGLNAVVVGWSELLCGAALVLGVMTRLATIPLIISMIVAIITAKRGDIHGFFDLVAFDEFTYMILLIVIAILGPGALAIDHALVKRYPRTDPPAKDPSS
jgi:putative oxidoreductase